MSRRSIRLLIGVAVSLAAIFLAVSGVDYRSVWATLIRTNLAILGLALVSIGVNNAAKAWRWKLLLGERGLVVSFWRLLHLHLVGQLLNQILPARAGDVSRVYLAGDLGVARAFVLGTLAIEKSIDLACYLLIGLLLLFLMPLPPWVSQPTYILALTAALAFAALIVAALFRRRYQGLPVSMARMLPTRLRARTEHLVDDGLASLHVIADRRFALRIVLLSGAVWITAVLTNALVLRALGIATSPVASVFVLFVLLVGINVPSVPGQIGIFQYLCVLALGVFAVDQTSALSFGVLLHILILLPLAVAGLAALWGFGPSLPALSSGVGESSQT